MARTAKQDRTERIPFGVPRLTMSLDEGTERRLKAAGKVPRWFNDTADRIQRALGAGYEFVTDAAGEVKTGDAKQVQEGDRHIKKRVGVQEDGQPLFAYLMAISREYYEEDQQRKEEANMKVDHAIRGGQQEMADVAAQHGSVEVKTDHQYRP